MDHTERTYLENLRRHLHRHPELSGQEKQTAAFIASELEKTNPDRLITGVGGTGVIGVYGSGFGEPQLMFRAELDALPIHESGKQKYTSTSKGVAHACGHDGHMAVIVGVARYLKENRPGKGRVLVLFQPSEETGEGAGRVIEDPAFRELVKEESIQRSYAFHNLPGFKKGKVFYREGTFASASTGLQFLFTGTSSHAAYPGQGNSPAGAVSELIQRVERAGKPGITGEHFSIATTTYIRVGEKAFGTSPGHAEVGVTLRATRDGVLKQLRDELQKAARNLEQTHNLHLDIIENEPFAATVNNKTCIEFVKKAAARLRIEAGELSHPFPWSEDFGRFAEVSDIALIGIGSGEDHPHLHAENFDFTDEIIPSAVQLFTSVIEDEQQ